MATGPVGALARGQPWALVFHSQNNQNWLLSPGFIHRVGSLRCLALPRARTHVCGIYKVLEIEATEDPLEIQY